jgi:hypothetical protein
MAHLAHLNIQYRGTQSDLILVIITSTYYIDQSVSQYEESIMCLLIIDAARYLRKFQLHLHNIIQYLIFQMHHQ